MKNNDFDNADGPTDNDLFEIENEINLALSDEEIEKEKISKSIKEIEDYSDFEINSVVDLTINHEKYSSMGMTYVVPEWISTTAFLVWQKRHPLTLPPCFAALYPKKPFLGSYTPAYEWPQA